MNQYDLVAKNPESTVVAEYQAEYRCETSYQYLKIILSRNNKT
jgi:hypothetical protein